MSDCLPMACDEQREPAHTLEVGSLTGQVARREPRGHWPTTRAQRQELKEQCLPSPAESLAPPAPKGKGNISRVISKQGTGPCPEGNLNSPSTVCLRFRQLKQCFIRIRKPRILSDPGAPLWVLFRTQAKCNLCRHVYSSTINKYNTHERTANAY